MKAEPIYYKITKYINNSKAIKRKFNINPIRHILFGGLLNLIVFHLEVGVEVGWAHTSEFKDHNRSLIETDRQFIVSNVVRNFQLKLDDHYYTVYDFTKRFHSYRVRRRSFITHTFVVTEAALFIL